MNDACFCVVDCFWYFFKSGSASFDIGGIKHDALQTDTDLRVYVPNKIPSSQCPQKSSTQVVIRAPGWIKSNRKWIRFCVFLENNSNQKHSQKNNIIDQNAGALEKPQIVWISHIICKTIRQDVNLSHLHPEPHSTYRSPAWFYVIYFLKQDTQTYICSSGAIKANGIIHIRYSIHYLPKVSFPCFNSQQEQDWLIIKC